MKYTKKSGKFRYERISSASESDTPAEQIFLLGDAPESAQIDVASAAPAINPVEPIIAGYVSENFMPMPGQPSLFAEPLGQLLAAAREARGLSQAEAASRLHLPMHVVQTIESNNFGQIGAGVYLRGYLTKYARLLDVPLDAVEEVMQKHVVAPPELIASGRISHSRYLLERYSGAALYVVLTGVIFVPLVMFAMNMGTGVGARLLPLDVPSATNVQPSTESADVAKTANGEIASSAKNPVAAALSAAQAATAETGSSEPPMMASLTPFSSQASQVDAHAAAAAATGSTQTLRLSLNEASWVEIVDADGKRLEYTILPAGTVRDYSSDKSLEMRIGNTNGAKLEVNGQVQDIAPYNRGNVAHFRLFAAGKTISRTDS